MLKRFLKTYPPSIVGGWALCNATRETCRRMWTREMSMHPPITFRSVITYTTEKISAIFQVEMNEFPGIHVLLYLP
jgi:hypothetical protein